ncbi:MAG: cytochrome c, partial [Flavobacterium sp.]
MKAILIIFLAFALHANAQSSGKTLFENKCSMCHGKDGARGWFGAKNLRKSSLTDAEYFTIISNGKKVMPTWKTKLDAGQINTI